MSKVNANIGTGTYLSLITADSKAKDKQQKEFVAKEAEHTVSVAVLETEKAIFQAKNDLSTAQSAEPYNLEREIDLLNTISTLEDGLAIAKEIQSVRFGK